MTTSAFYTTLGMKGYDHCSTFDRGGVLRLTMEAPAKAVRCPECGTFDVGRRGTRTRQLHAPRVGMRTTELLIHAPRVWCPECCSMKTIRLPGVVPGKSYTHSFARMAVDLRKMMTIKDTARYVGVSEHTIRGIDKDYLQRRFAKPRLRDLRQIAIDEFSVASGHKYFTVVLDLESGAIVFAGEGKGEDALKPFWKRLRGSQAKIRAVATDMSSAYYAAAQKNIPNATHVFDRFHIVKLMNDKLTTLRRQLYHETEDMLDRNILKGTRWLLLKNPQNLDDDRNEQQRLKDALQLNSSLSIAYYLKEDLRQIWEQTGKREAGKFLTDWCKRAHASGIQVLKTMANTLLKHRRGILNWYDYRISTGPLEGTNNKIKTLKRQAYGIRDTEYFKLKLYALHLAKFELIG
jgi:transposase